VSWTVVLTGSAQRDLRRLDPPVAKRILDALARFADTGQGNLRRIGSSYIHEWQLRVGDWRVRFRRDDVQHLLIVLQIRHRGEAYR
jgi:mRNA interferase RelE/StbE